MRDYIPQFEQMLDKQWLTEHILNLYRIERQQTFPAYQKAAQYTYDLLKNEGYAAELLNFPADGKTVYQDKCSPIGWDVSRMQLQQLYAVTVDMLAEDPCALLCQDPECTFCRRYRG